MALSIALFLLLGLPFGTKVSAQSPSIVSSTTANRIYGCPDEAVTYICKGSGSLLIWEIPLFTQVVYESTNSLGAGFLRGPFATNLISVSPQMISSLTVTSSHDDLNLTCTVDVSTLVSVQAFYGISDSPAPLQNVSIRPIDGGVDIGAVVVNWIIPATIHFDIESYLIELYIDDNLEETLHVSSNNPMVLFTRPSSTSVTVFANVSILTECKQKSSAATSNILPYSFVAVQTTTTDPMTTTTDPMTTTTDPMTTTSTSSSSPNPGYLIGLIVLAVLCLILITIVVFLVLCIACKNHWEHGNQIKMGASQQNSGELELDEKP